MTAPPMAALPGMIRRFAIAWPAGTPILSDKDRAAPRLADIPAPFPQGSW